MCAWGKHACLPALLPLGMNLTEALMEEENAPRGTGGQRAETRRSWRRAYLNTERKETRKERRWKEATTRKGARRYRRSRRKSRRITSVTLRERWRESILKKKKRKEKTSLWEKEMLSADHLGQAIPKWAEWLANGYGFERGQAPSGSS